MEACEPLKKHAWLAESIRQNQKAMKNLKVAVDAAISEMPDEFVIKKFLLSNKQVATYMLRDNEQLEKIAKYSCLAKDAIRKLAETIGLTVI